MLKIRPFERSDVYDIELDYFFPSEQRDSLLTHQDIVGFTLLEGEEVLAVGGVHVLWFGVGEGWVLVSPRCFELPAAFARYTKRAFNSILQDTNLRRIQASVHTDDKKAIRFANWLMFEDEGIMRNYGVDGSDYLRMARVQ